MSWHHPLLAYLLNILFFLLIYYSLLTYDNIFFFLFVTDKKAVNIGKVQARDQNLKMGESGIS